MIGLWPRWFDYDLFSFPKVENHLVASASETDEEVVYKVLIPKGVKFGKFKITKTDDEVTITMPKVKPEKKQEKEVKELFID